jgi:hypothetical protein
MKFPRIKPAQHKAIFTNDAAKENDNPMLGKQILCRQLLKEARVGEIRECHFTRCNETKNIPVYSK